MFCVISFKFSQYAFRGLVLGRGVATCNFERTNRKLWPLAELVVVLFPSFLATQNYLLVVSQLHPLAQ